MKILHYLGSMILPSDPEEKGAGGTTRVALELARAQQRRGHEVWVVSTAKRAWRVDWRGVRLAALRATPWPLARSAVGVLDVRSHPPLVRLALTHRFDVVHGHEYPYLRFVRAGLRIAHIHNNPFWTEPYPDQWGYQTREFRSLQRYSDVRLAVSEYVARQFVKGCENVLRLQDGGRHLSVIHNGVDAARFGEARLSGRRAAVRRSLGMKDDEVVFFFAGAVAAEKGVIHLARAFVRLATELRGVRLLVAGGAALWGNDFRAARAKDSLYESEVEAILEPVRDRVHWLGVMPSSRMPDLYAASDVFVLPSLQEAFGLVIVEAFATGLPVIASAVGGIPELTSRDNAVLVPPEDSDALTVAMRSLAEQPELRARMAASAASVACSMSWERSAARLDDVYSAYASRNSKARLP